MKRNTALLGAVALGASSAIAAQPASDPTAQMPADILQLEEVTVTAQRREQTLLSVPISISAVTGDQLTRSGVTDTSDLGRIVPNLQINSAYGRTEPNFSLRGISVGNEFNSNQASPVGVYVDDAFLGARTLHGAQLFDLDRVEVLRGPQGTLFGRNTTGGAINMITRAPVLGGDNGFVEGGIGNFADYRLQGAYEHTFAPEILGSRVAFTYEHSNGLFNNVYPGARDPATNDSLAGRWTTRYQPVSQLDVLVKVYGGRDRPSMAAVHSIGVGPNGANPFTGYTRSGLDFFTVDSDHAGSTSTVTYGGLVKIKYALSDAISLHSLTSYDVGNQQLTNDTDGSPVAVLDTAFGTRSRQVNQEFHVNYANDWLDLIGGLYYGWDRLAADNHYDFLYFLGALGVPADPTLQNGGAGVVQTYVQIRDSTAIFEQADLKLTPKLTLTAGFRYSWDTIEYADGRAYLTDYAGNPLVSTIPGPGPYTTAPLGTQKHNESAPTYRAALNYTFDGGQIAYGSFSRGFRSGAYNGSGYLSPAQITYVKPETVDAFEIGVKGHFLNDRWKLSVSAFNYDYKNQQVQETVGFVAFLRNAGKSTLRGGELELEGVLARDFVVSGSVGYLHSRYDTLTLSGVDLAGNQLPFAPDLTARLAADWRLGWVAGGQLSFNPSVSYTSREFFSPFNNVNGNQNLHQGALTRGDASLAWRRDNLTLRLWANNITNEKYYVYGFDLRTVGFDYLTPGLQRTYGVSARYAF